MSVQWDQVVATASPVLLGLGGAVWGMVRERRKQHRENQIKLDALIYDQIYLVPHDHIESRNPGGNNTALTRDGIIYRPPNGGGKKRESP